MHDIPLNDTQRIFADKNHNLALNKLATIYSCTSRNSFLVRFSIWYPSNDITENLFVNFLSPRYFFLFLYV